MRKKEWEGMRKINNVSVWSHGRERKRKQRREGNKRRKKGRQIERETKKKIERK